MHEMVENIKRPLVMGEIFLVPCIVKEFTDDVPEKKKVQITPVINIAHDDIENGQNEIHYHADFRFIKTDKSGAPINMHSRYHFCITIRPIKELNGKLYHYLLPVVDESGLYKSGTPIQYIEKSRLSHNCIHKGKCPHKGFDLSQAEVIDGVIKCPLHGLEFDAITGYILNFKNIV